MNDSDDSQVDVTRELLARQVSQFRSLLNNVDEQIELISRLIRDLDEFGRLPVNSDILFPLANGIFAKGKLSANDTLIVNVGADIVASKSVTDTAAMLASQISDLQVYRDDTLAQLHEVATQLEVLTTSHV